MIRASIFALALITFTGCDKKKEEGGATASKGTETAQKASVGPTKLPKLGLSIEAPGSVEVGDAIMGEGHMLQGSGIGAMQIEIASKPQTLDEAKSDADMYTPKNLKAEALPDGWWLTFENTGSAGKNYFVQVRRDIGGKTYTCSTTGGEEKQAQAVLAACKSLKQ